MLDIELLQASLPTTPTKDCAVDMTTPAPSATANARRASTFVTPGVMRVAANDADEFSESMRDWDIELKQLQPGTFDAALTVMPLGPVLICSGRFNGPLLQYSGPPRGCISINRPGRGSAPLSIQGHELQAGEILVSGSGAEAEVLQHGVLFPTAFSVKVDFLQAQTHWLSDALLPASNTVQRHSPGAQWASSFLDAMEWIVAAVAEYPDIINREDVRVSVIDTLLARVNTLGAPDAPALSTARATRAARRQAVERAREYIRVNLTEPIRLSDLCKHAHAQARSLEYGFHEVVGVSPIAYIRATRMHRARQLLRSTAVRTRSISEIALDCGFWHLSQFAVDYKRLFRESPSVTFRRTQAQLPRARRNAPTASYQASHAAC